MVDWFTQFVSIKDAGGWLLNILPNIVALLAVLIGFWILYLVTRPILRHSLSKSNADPEFVRLIVNKLYKAVIIIFAILMGLHQIGIDIAAAIAAVGVVGIALAFAAKDSISNLIAGLMIFFDKPFSHGDLISVAGKTGRVDEITMRSTRIKSFDGTSIVIPNQSIIDQVLENKSAFKTRRLQVTLGIDYGASIDEARKIILKTVNNIEGVLSDPEVAVAVTELAGSSVNLNVRAWVDDSNENKAGAIDIREACKKAMDEAGINMPYPTRDVNINSEE